MGTRRRRASRRAPASSSRSSPRLRGRKPAKPQRAAGSPDATSAVTAALGSRQHLDREPLAQALPQQRVPGVAHQRRAGVGDERDARPRADPLGQLARPGRFVVLVEADEGPRVDAVAVEQDPRAAGVLARDHISGGQLLERAQRDVSQVADRRRADGQASDRRPRGGHAANIGSDRWAARSRLSTPVIGPGAGCSAAPPATPRRRRAKACAETRPARPPSRPRAGRAGPRATAAPDAGEIRSGGAGRGRSGRLRGGAGGWRRWATPKRIVLGVLALIVGWLLLSLLLFLISSHFNRTPLEANVAGALDPAGNPLTSANNILVLGSDRRQKNSKEPGAEKSGPGRSDTILLLRTGGGHSARLSIPRDTVVQLPNGQGLSEGQRGARVRRRQGVRRSHQTLARHPDQPRRRSQLRKLPAADRRYGRGRTTRAAASSPRSTAASPGAATRCRLPAGTHHIDGKQALAIARTRENLCQPNANDIQREEHQQALFNAMKSRLLSPSSFFRLPWIAWNAPPAIISDMSGPTLLSLFCGDGGVGARRRRTS